MTDQRMDARLREAGERWRAANTGATPSVELDEIEDLPPVRRAPRRSRFLMAAAAAAVVGLVAGGAFVLRGGSSPRPAPNAESSGLEHTVWVITGLDGNTPTQRSTATLYIDGKGHLVADDDCRVVGATVEQSGTRLTMSNVSVRYKSCVDQYAPGIYDKGTEILRGPATYAIDGNALTITRAGTGTMHLRAADADIAPPSLDTPAITDTNWALSGGSVLRIAENGSVLSPCAGGHATFDASSVRFTSCAGWNGPWQWVITGTRLQLKSVHDTRDLAWEPADPAVTDPARLIGPTWHLRAVAGEPPAARSASLHFTTGAVTGNDGCASVTRPATIGHGSFRIAAIAVPSGCTGGIADQATTIDSFLTAPNAAWALRDGALVVYGGGAQAFSLVYGTDVRTATLQGDWTLSKLLNATGDQQPVTALARLKIAPDGTLTGTDGCRPFSGSVTSSGNTATFALTMPEPACSTRVEQTASLADRVFGGPVTYEVGPTSLVLRRDGVGSLTFTTTATGQPDPNALLAHEWQVAAITFGNGPYRDGAPSQEPAVLAFTGTSYTLAHTCSAVTGAARRDSGTIDFSDPQTSEHSCPAPPPGSTRDQAAQAIDAILSGQVNWAIDASTLTLETNDGKLVLTANGGNVTDLTANTWRLTGTEHGSTASSAIGDATLTFPDDTTLSITRCYTSQATADIRSDSMTLTGLHVTNALPCPSGPPGTQEQNDFIDSVLDGDLSWSIDGDQLTLTHGTDALTFTRRP